MCAQVGSIETVTYVGVRVGMCSTQGCPLSEMFGRILPPPAPDTSTDQYNKAIENVKNTDENHMSGTNHTKGIIILSYVVYTTGRRNSV